MTVDMTVSTLVDLARHHLVTARTPIVVLEIACSEGTLTRSGLASPANLHLAEQICPARPRPAGCAGGGSQCRTAVTAG